MGKKRGRDQELVVVPVHRGAVLMESKEPRRKTRQRRPARPMKGKAMVTMAPRR